jgi:porin
VRRGGLPSAGPAILFLGCTLVCGLPLRSQAQPANIGGTNVQPGAKTVGGANEPVAAESAGEEHLLGDWGGVRTSLGDLGIDLQLGDTNEFAADVSGGLRHSATNAGQATFQADVDWGKLAGLRGFATHIAVVGRYGANESALLGDQLSPVQEIYGAGGNVVAHLVYLYAEQTTLGGRLTIAAGRMPVGNDFATSPLYCNFMNNILCGNPKALVGNIGGFTAWPTATWGGRVRYRPTAQTYVQLGLYEVSQAVYSNMAGFRSGWKFDASADSGVEVPIEVSLQPSIGADKLVGHYKLGAGYDSSRYAAFNQQSDFLLPGATAPIRYSQGRMQYWALADQMLVRHGKGTTDGVILLGGWIHDDPSTSFAATRCSAGSRTTISGRRGQRTPSACWWPIPASATASSARNCETRHSTLPCRTTPPACRPIRF